jgi:nitroimidazol reductase NimA-like FMN-containing flavoprotein (pyridoxamine 5'-phosphate oxidase superfamily)
MVLYYNNSPRSRVRRVPDRASYEREVIGAILEEGFLCHLAFVDHDTPVVIPTLYARLDGDLYLHGSAASRALRRSAASTEVCLSVTLVDGLVLARSAFHHSINYRSVVVFGNTEPVESDRERLKALQAFMEKLVPGRSNDVRPPSAQELKGTAIVRVRISEATAKTRQGPPTDKAEDYDLDHWAGVVPIELRRMAAEPDPVLRSGIETPDYVERALSSDRQQGPGFRPWALPR